jgi:hypothetical protein
MDTGYKMRRFLSRHPLRVAAHRAGKGDYAVVHFNSDIGFPDACIPREFENWLSELKSALSKKQAIKAPKPAPLR